MDSQNNKESDTYFTHSLKETPLKNEEVNEIKKI